MEMTSVRRGSWEKKKKKKDKVEPTVILENNFHPFFKDK